MEKNTAIRKINGRGIPHRNLARLLDCTEDHVSDILAERVRPLSREMAILRLCAGSAQLDRILSDLSATSEWRTIPGFENYEITRDGMVRRASGGHGSQAGRVLKARGSASGYLRLNLSQNGVALSMHVHVLVCLTYNGPPPGTGYIVCHRNDITDDNRHENLYWGTQADNAADRSKNAPTRPQRMAAKPKKDTILTRARKSQDALTRRQLRKATQEQMDRRLGRLRRDA